MTLKVKTNAPIYNTSWESQDAYLMPILLYYLKSIKNHHENKPNFLEF